MEIDVVNLRDARRMVKWAVLADRPVMLWGDPGIGKSAIVFQLAQELGLPAHALIASQSAPEDAGGIPVPQQGGVIRSPIGPVARCVEAPGLLFLDELPNANTALQGAFLTMVNERYAGDARLHAGTRIVAAGNDPETGAGAGDLAPPMVGRFHHIRVEPEISEVQSYLDTLGPDGSTLRALAADLSATLDRSPDLLQLKAPAGVQATPEPWASPRSWERALRIRAAAIDGGEDANDERVARMCMAGSVGRNVTASYLAILRVRDRIASPAEILRDPVSARLPTDTDTGIASLGVIAMAAAQDVAPAWVYAQRLNPEIRVSIASRLSAIPIRPDSPHAAAGQKAKIALLADLSRSIANANKGRK
jgi:MoxR-like ATPase